VPEVDEKVMKFVEDTLEKSPGIQLEELFQRTKEFSSSMGKLTKRQFNARYPLQVKRRRALAAKRKGGVGPKKAGPGRRSSRKVSVPSAAPRDLVRAVLLQFATDIAAAEERKDLVKVLAGVDHYVDEVLKGVEGS
jgi:hypothetical protein